MARPNARQQRLLAGLAVLFAALMVGIGMWPYRHQIATVTFWLMVLTQTLGALAIFVMLLAGVWATRDALRSLARVEQDEASPSAARGVARDERTKPISSLPPMPHPPATFKGRQRELDELAAAIEGGSVTVYGAGGVGKTALALELAHRSADAYPDGQLFVDMKGTSAPLAAAHVMGQVIHTLHPRAALPAPPSDRRHLYYEVLRGRQTLLILDDAGEAAQIEPLLPPDSCTLVVTSREPLPLPDAYALDLGPMSEPEAEALLREIAPRIADDGIDAVAAEIAGLCEGLPLAQTLMASALAARVHGTPSIYVSRLRDLRDFLDPVEAALRLSYGLLDRRLQRLWARLSVFTIPFDVQAAAAVWEMQPGPGQDALCRLLRFGLIDRRENTACYVLHALARDFAYRKLEQIEDPRRVHRLAAAHFGTKLSDAKEDCRVEEALEAVDQWERAEAWSHFARLANELMRHMHHVSYWQEVEARLERGLAAVQDHLVDPHLEAGLLTHLGIIARKREAWQRAVELHERSLQVCERASLDQGAAQTSFNLAAVRADMGEWDQAIALYQKSLAFFEQEGDEHRAARTWMALGVVYRKEKELDQAIEMIQRSITSLERLQDRYGLSRAWSHLGRTYAHQLDWDQAIACYEKALQIREALDDRSGAAQALTILGTAYAGKGAWDQAMACFERALPAWEALGDAHGIAKTRTNLARGYYQQNDYDHAIQQYRQSLQIFQRLADDHSAAQTWLNLGHTCAEKGDWQKAIEHYSQSLEICEQMEDDRLAARAWFNLGRAFAQKGDWQKAIEHYGQSLAIFERMEDDHPAAYTWFCLGRAHAERGDSQKAIEHYRKSMKMLARLDNALGVAVVRTNIGMLCLRSNKVAEAKRHLGPACLALAHIGSPLAPVAARGLVTACGSAEVAHAYLAEMFMEVD